jgi:hypothetical protein
MKEFFREVIRWLAVLFWLIGMVAVTMAGITPGLGAGGHWEGAIQLPTTALQVRLDLMASAEAGTWRGTIDIPAQGLRSFALSEVLVEGTNVSFEMGGIPGKPKFSGRLTADGNGIAGEFKQAGQEFAFMLERKAKVERAGETPTQGVKGTGLAGFWQGSLTPTPAVELRLLLEVTNLAAGGWGGVMVSLDQGGARMGVVGMTNAGATTRFAVPSVGGAFSGKLAEDGSELAGDWSQGGRSVAVVFKRLAKAPRLARPQDPVKPYPYREEEVVVTNAEAGIQLAGTLTMPENTTTKFPGVVLVTGSGPQDRDEAIMGHRPFLVLADYLTRQGIAVLRCDDRGVGKSTENFASATHEDFTTDVLAAFDYLKGRSEVDPKKIGLIGHSEGGLIAPLAATRRADVAFLVLIAGVGVPVEELLVRQGQDISRLMGISEETIAANAEIQRQVFDIVEETKDPATAEKRLRDLLEGQVSTLSERQRQVVGLTPDGISAQVKTMLSPWFRGLLAYDPRLALRAVKCPVLAVNGEKDVQVAARENLESIRENLAAGGNQRVRTVALPGLNHLLQKCETGAVFEYGSIEETMNAEALRVIGEWVREMGEK